MLSRLFARNYLLLLDQGNFRGLFSLVVIGGNWKLSNETKLLGLTIGAIFIGLSQSLAVQGHFLVSKLGAFFYESKSLAGTSVK